jgi:HemK-like putative methylase
MITKIKNKWDYIPSLNFGITFLQIFIWLNLVLIALLFEKGLDAIFNIYNIKELQNFEFSLWPPHTNLTWVYISYFLLFINYLILSIRYLFWTPWPIYNNIFNLIDSHNNIKNNIKGKEFYKEFTSNIRFNRLIWGITNINGFELFWSAIILVVEFYIIYLGINTFGNIQLTIVYIFILPLVDFIIPIISSLFRINRETVKKTISTFKIKNKANKHYYKSRKWLLPWVFMRPFAIDIIVPGFILFIVLQYINYSNNNSFSFETIQFFNLSSKDQFIITIGVIISLLFTNYWVIKLLKRNYFDASHVLFNLSEIDRAVHSPDRPEPYQNGKIKFMDIELNVDERVYPPTPETERLVNEAINILSKYNREVEVIDVGTGSANIAIELAKKIQKIKIHAIDISPEALDVARENIDHFKLNNISLKESDLLKNTDGYEIKNPDLIVANLPWGSNEYLLESNKKNPRSLRYMPSVALFPSKGLIGHYVSLIEEIIAKEWNTTLLMETGPIPEEKILAEINELSQEKLSKIIPQLIGNNKYSILKVVFNPSA